MRIEQPLRNIAEKSSLKYVDIAAGDELMPTVLPGELPIWQDSNSNCSCNSGYWRTLGAAWGGMISTAEDLGRLAGCLLNGGESGGLDAATNTIWNSAVVDASLSNQSQHIAGLSEADRVQHAWGFGWRRNWLHHSATFSDFLSADAIGHWGATGTMMWIEPASSHWCVILTTQPYEHSRSVIQRMSNVVAVAYAARVRADSPHQSMSQNQPLRRDSSYTGHSVPQSLQWNPTMVAVPGTGRRFFGLTIASANSSGSILWSVHSGQQLFC